jgi:hypothetical protein
VSMLRVVKWRREAEGVDARNCKPEVATVVKRMKIRGRAVRGVVRPETVVKSEIRTELELKLRMPCKARGA